MRWADAAAQIGEIADNIGDICAALKRLAHEADEASSEAEDENRAMIEALYALLDAQDAAERLFRHLIEANKLLRRVQDGRG